MKYSVKLILLAPVMFSFLLLSSIFAPQASAASHLTEETSMANLQSGSKVVPLVSGGGCYDWERWPLPSRIEYVSVKTNIMKLSPMPMNLPAHQAISRTSP